MDQPSFDGFNTYTVARAASEAGLKVALSGLGADELFYGYRHFNRILKLEQIRRLPTAIRFPARHALTAVQRGTQGRKMGAWLSGALPRGAAYELLRCLFLPREVDALMVAAYRGKPASQPRLLDFDGDILSQISAIDLSNYTKNVLLRDTDAMSMAVSLEVRVPFLDDELVRWALSVRGDTKERAGKALLIAATRDVIPAAVSNRKKQGFLLPIKAWMQGPLRASIDATLSSPPDELASLLDTSTMRSTWRGFHNGRQHWVRPWALYVLNRWTQESLSMAGAELV
jgi:asparagine synthase (glutamine-hydrolysing)